MFVYSLNYPTFSIHSRSGSSSNLCPDPRPGCSSVFLKLTFLCLSVNALRRCPRTLGVTTTDQPDGGNATGVRRVPATRIRRVKRNGFGEARSPRPQDLTGSCPRPRYTASHSQIWRFSFRILSILFSQRTQYLRSCRKSIATSIH